MVRREKPNRLPEEGFTLIELIVVMVVMAILASLAISGFRGARERAFVARARAEFNTMEKALEFYKFEYGGYPPDVSRNIPPGIQEFLAPNDADRWPNGPWPDSVYDYDQYFENFDDTGEPIYQISIRYCDFGEPDTCQFPRSDWADDFEVNSSLYFCIEGPCRPHPDEAPSYPGYCINCND